MVDYSKWDRIVAEISNSGSDYDEEVYSEPENIEDEQGCSGDEDQNCDNDYNADDDDGEEELLLDSEDDDGNLCEHHRNLRDAKTHSSKDKMINFGSAKKKNICLETAKAMLGSNFENFKWTPESVSQITMENVNKVSKVFAAQLAQNPEAMKKKGGVIMTFSNDGSCSAKVFEGIAKNPNNHTSNNELGSRKILKKKNKRVLESAKSKVSNAIPSIQTKTVLPDEEMIEQKLEQSFREWDGKAGLKEWIGAHDMSPKKPSTTSIMEQQKLTAPKTVSNSTVKLSLPEEMPITKRQMRLMDPSYRLHPQELPIVIGYSTYQGKLNIVPEMAYLDPEDDRNSMLHQVFAQVKHTLPEDDYPEHYCPTDDSEDDDIELLPAFGKAPDHKEIIYRQISDYALRSIQRKYFLESLQSRANGPARVESSDTSLYILHVRLCGIRPAVWRRIRVPCNISLSMLHDKVICPTLGWCRNYHAYMFTLPTVMYAKNKKPHPLHDISFGPVRARNVDFIHRSVRRGGNCMIDDTKVSIKDLLSVPGQYLKYMYDLGDAWKHKITLEAVLPELDDPDEPQFAVLDGFGACPAEDCGSMFAYCEKLVHLADPKNEKFHETIEQLFMAKNKVETVRAMMKTQKINFDFFDPFYFNLESTQNAIHKALRTKASYVDDANTIRWTVKANGEIAPQKVCRKVMPIKFCSNCGKTDADLKARNNINCNGSTTTATTTALGEDSKLKLCSRCLHVHYCSLVCQHEDWKFHKRLCVLIEDDKNRKFQARENVPPPPPASSTATKTANPPPPPRQTKPSNNSGGKSKKKSSGKSNRK